MTPDQQPCTNEVVSEEVAKLEEIMQLNVNFQHVVMTAIQVADIMSQSQ